jgi:3-hydroxy acid dehydrogenase/malonic semialdehyde reductase
MNRLSGKVALVTGASSGIGEACARALAAEGARVIVAARRREALAALAAELEEGFVVELDVRDREAVERAVVSLPAEWAEIDILVNNAGLGRGLDKLHEGDVDEWEEMVDTNVKGLLYVTRAVVPGMVSRGRGHVVNIGSVAGLEVYPGGNVYCATKHAVDAITKGLRMDVVDTPVRVSTVDPGMVETEFSMVRFKGDAERARKVYQGIDALTGDDIADAVVYCVTRPPHVSINQIVVTPTSQASALVVHRE